MSPLARIIPTNIRYKLRKEVNFGCPVDGCGIPFLKYHHFEIPYRKLRDSPDAIHDPNRIIALCPLHADHADGNAWTDDQLRNMKNNPFLTGNQIESRFNYMREKILIRFGSIFDMSKDILVVRNEEIVGFTENSNGLLGLNLKIRDSGSNLILQMENNDWIVNTDNTFDLICPPQGKELHIKSNDDRTNFTIRYDEFSIPELKRELLNDGYTNSDSLIERIENRNKILLVTLTGIIYSSQIPMTITKNSFQYGGMQMSNCMFIGGARGFTFN